MCTHITTTAAVTGSGKGASGWFPVTQVSVGYDHATQGTDEHALLLDFVNYDVGLGARVAVELDLKSARALLESLQVVIADAAASGV
ncbi:DUF6295 family protein [Mycobacterium sp. C31M]